VKDASFYVGGLLDLHKLRQESDKRATWRQSMAALARAMEDEGPGPLDALHPEALLQGVKAALASGLVDDLDWLEPSKAGAALYELASALPLGPERRDLGRRVLARMLDGNAEAFVALATRMALGAGKGLSTPAVRARIVLVTELPLTMHIADGPLALALAQRRELAREWIDQPSTGSLAARRLAARLLERAAREAARRALQGDLHALRAFRGDAVARAYKRLLADRESLVWRHVAVARGLLSPWVPEIEAELEASLGTGLSPTEWRRGATSIAAKIAVDAERALKMAKAALAGGVLLRDSGIGQAFVWGIARAAEAEPEAASALLDALVSEAGIAEAVVDLYAELGPVELVDRAARKVAEVLAQKLPATADDGAVALGGELLRDLDRSPRQDEPVRDMLSRSLAAYVTSGARAAHAAARDVLEAATGEMAALSAVGDDDEGEGKGASMARRTSLAVLRDLDMSLLERGVLDCLLRLGASSAGSASAPSAEEGLDDLRERLAEWILARESLSSPGDAPPPHPTLHLRRLRALVHLVDSDVGDALDDARGARMRGRWQRIAGVLARRFEKEPHGILRRSVSASFVRALDALVRIGAIDVTDALLVAARTQPEAGEFEMLAEAAMDPDLVHVFARYARFLQEWAAAVPAGDPESTSGERNERPFVARQLAALDELTRELVPDASGRREVLRTVLVRLHGSLAAVQAAPSLRALSSSGGNDPDVLGALELYVTSLAQLVTGARARLLPRGPADDTAPPPAAAGSDPVLSRAVSRVLEGLDAELDENVVHAWLTNLDARVPVGIARVIGSCVATLLTREVERPSVVVALTVPEAQLPAWLPASRTLGGFYVQRALGKGAVGSVFVCTRSEDRQDPNAERFALKVPEYSATAARNLSESQFLQLFREEASALMAVPQHPNLARFVTFDLSARPKPILVMELVEGDILERVISSRAFDVPRALRALDGVLAGLEAMHTVGVGHLDLKPSNVVQRKDHESVLVDFGLAGRHIRPGCATGPYGAPEVWGVVPDKFSPLPPMADVYAFGCLAYEALTGKVLFAADSEIAQISLHLAHDGLPAPLKAFGARDELAPLSEMLFATLRRDPRSRPTVTRLRRELASITPRMTHLSWPIA